MGFRRQQSYLYFYGLFTRAAINFSSFLEQTFARQTTRQNKKNRQESSWRWLRSSRTAARCLSPSPGRGGTRVPDLQPRKSALSVKQMGREDDAVITNLHDDGKHPHKKTAYNWAKREEELSEPLPHKMNSSNPAEVSRGEECHFCNSLFAG